MQLIIRDEQVQNSDAQRSKTLDCTSTTFPSWPSFCTAHRAVHDLSHLCFQLCHAPPLTIPSLRAPRDFFFFLKRKLKNTSYCSTLLSYFTLSHSKPGHPRHCILPPTHFIALALFLALVCIHEYIQRRAFTCHVQYQQLSGG